MFYRSKENQKKSKRNVEYNLYLIAHNGSGFDSFIVLNNLTQWRSVVKLNKNGAGFISLKTINGYVDPNKKIPQYVHFRCSRVHINKVLKKGKVINYKKNYLKNYWNIMKFMRTLGKLEKMSGYLMLRTTYYQLLSVMLDTQWVRKN